MRVLFLTHSYPRTPGDAAGSFLLHLATALQGEQVDVRVVAPAADQLPAEDVLGGIPVYRFRYAPRRYQRLAYTGTMAEDVRRSFSAKLALLGFLGSEFASGTRVRRDFEPDLVHAHWWFPGGLVGTWVAALGHLPLVTTMHGTDIRLARASGVARPLLRHVLGHSRAVTTVSSWLADEVRNLVPGVEPTVSPMPVATSLFSPDGAVRSDRFLFVGRLNEQKGLELLLEALAAMEYPAGLDVVGDGPARDTLRLFADSLGIGERVTWHGSLPQPELAARYRAALALVVPSLDEGLGLVAVEAQLCATPVVAFASGGLLDIIRDGETGYLVPPGDVAALSARLDAVRTDPSRNAIAQAGRQSALARYAPESVARRYAQLYRSVLDGA